MKYIDSEKLIYEIENKWRELADKNVKAGGNKYDGEISAYLSVKNLITSLQQEQPEVNLAEEITKFFSENPIPHEHITDWPLLKNTALHFFNHGLNAKKEK